MDIFMISIAQLLFGIFMAGVLFVVVAICYSTLYWMRDDHARDDRSEESWNEEHKFFHTIEEFRSDFS